jgi:hypothetical protein
MNAVHEDLLRAATALQVATFEHMSAEDAMERGKAYRAMKACLERATETVSALRRYKIAEVA